MKNEIVDEIIACLPKERTLFHYFQGQYAYLLLFYIAHKHQNVAALKQSNYKKLLNQKQIKQLLSQQGSGKIDATLFEHVWQADSQAFVLTVDKFGTDDQWHYQTTRKGCNLVLQLNFSEQHNRAYQRLIKPMQEHVFNFYDHPVMDRKKRDFHRDTLAWARIDLDFDTGEALIEEIQSDWVRRVKECVTEFEAGYKSWYLTNCKCNKQAFLNYAEHVFKPFYKLWSEAMLTATIQFIVSELGIRQIYYHTHETGNKIKDIWGGAPRSLYTDLPKKFCFDLTQQDPEFIQNDRSFKRKKRRIKTTNWYQLSL